MTFAPLIPLIGTVCNILLAVFVLTRDFRSSINRVYFFLGTAVATWNLGQVFLFVVSDATVAMRFLQLEWLAIIFGPVLLFHLSLLISGTTASRVVWLFYAIAAGFAVLNFNPIFLKGVRYLENAGWYAVPGTALFFFHPLFTSLVAASIYVLYRRRKKLPRLHRHRLDALIFAQMLLLGSGLNDVLPIFGIDHYPLTSVHVFPYGSVLASFYGIIVAYSVLQHNLLNVQVSLGHFSAQIVRFIFLFIVGVTLLLTSTLLLPGHFTSASLAASLGVLLLTGIIASIFFPRLFGTGVESIEHRILGDRFEYHDRIRSFIASVERYNELELLLDDLEALLLRTVSVENYVFVLTSERRRDIDTYRVQPMRTRKKLQEFAADSPIMQYFRSGSKDCLLSGNQRLTSGRDSLEIQARERAQVFELELVFPLASSDETFGLLGVGKKRSGDPYTTTDVNLLTLLSKKVALIVNQIRLKDQLLLAQELDLLGRMSRGMAHDLNNLLTPVHTFLQLAAELPGSNSLNEELLPVAIRNIATMRAYIREALFFSQNLRPDFQLARLDVLLRGAIELVGDRAARRNIGIQLLEDEEDARVELDSVLVERLITNLLSNAIDASPSENSVNVELRRLPQSENRREWFRISIRDRGPGISKNDLNRIFTPYFTTKKTGDESRGFGLGLAICRKIVNLHGGSLDVLSREGQGTVVNVDLPSRQLKDPQPVAHKLE